MVEVRTSFGLDMVDEGRGAGVAGACGLCSVFAVVKAGLTVGVYGAAVAET